MGRHATASVTADYLKEQLIRHYRDEITLPNQNLEIDTEEEKEKEATSASSSLFSRQPSLKERKEEENRALVGPTQRGSNPACTIM